jgi:hypothetical protein
MHNFTSIFTPVHAVYDTAMRNAKKEHSLFSGDTVYRTTLACLKDQYELPGADEEIESLAIFYGQGIDKALHHWSDVLAANNAKELL